MSKLYEKYKKEVVPALMKRLDYKNPMAVPKIEKVVINVGVGQNSKDANFIKQVEKNIMMITGQKPISTKAKKSISNFKIRQGMVIGVKVTLRKKMMYDFLDKLINITLPRIRDFRGVSPESFDGKGNLNLGFKEQIPFPEIRAESIEKLHGLEVSILTSAKTDKEGLELLKLMGFPFKET